MPRALPLLKPDLPIPGVSGRAIGDFWSWAYSDVTMNTTRAIYAEWLVGLALDVTDTPRQEWAEHDLTYRDTKIEVKSAAYLQSWENSKHSIISFEVESRVAQIHVFCVQTDKESTKADMLNPDRLKFFVIPTRLILAQKNISLTRIKDICGKAALSQPVIYDRLQNAVDRACEWIALREDPETRGV